MSKRKTPQEIVLENVVIRAASVHNSDKREARIELTAKFSSEIREHMNWNSPPENYRAVDLFGTLAISQAILTPNAPVAKNGDMGQFKEIFPAQDLNGFNLVPLKDKGGEITGWELRFTLRSDKLNVPGQCGRYVAKLGRAPGTMVVVLADDDRQESFEAGE